MSMQYPQNNPPQDRRINTSIPADATDFIPGVGQRSHPLTPEQAQEERRARMQADIAAHAAMYPPRQARDKAQYVRQQKGHSLTLHLLLGAFVLWIPAIYISVSPNHYWHA